MVKIGITGHRGLPAELTERITGQLDTVLTAFDPVEIVGVTCLADGADTLFAEQVLAYGGTVEVIVPAAEYRDGLPVDHHVVYDRVLSQATQVHRLDYVDSSSESHMAASILMLSLISELVAVWDGQPSRAYGGTADVVDEARKRDIPVRIVWPEGATRP